ncbi:hypothetical protein [Bradyrhizobium cosmicum]|uniref:hypothetical protein n=1 Tax=Bradyrhizobium cosmicum TaxID=1404864 RepID=UPI001164386B|nr:hypothetical protein [Bradyrhizobium cosmicum]QDP24070.1 hypothetical protein FNV92_18740 [Bradyrhizobium cosmicum]
MITEEDFAAVADCPPDLAFARLEKKFRDRLETNIEHSQNNNSWAHYVIEYMNYTHAAAEALRLDFLDSFSVPDEDQTSNLNDIHNAFLRAVDNYTVRAHIRNVRHGPSNSLPLDEHDKKHIRAYVTKIKEIVEASALEIGKKETLMNTLNAFLAEVDRDRTSMQRFSDFMMGLAKTTADATEELEPTWKWARLIAAIFGARYDAENAKLPPPQKKIESPKPKLPPPRSTNGRNADMDDDIPF